MVVAGIDLGSGTTKCVLVDDDRTVRGRGLVRTKADFGKVAREALDAALADARLPADAVALHRHHRARALRHPVPGHPDHGPHVRRARGGGRLPFDPLRPRHRGPVLAGDPAA